MTSSASPAATPSIDMVDVLRRSGAATRAFVAAVRPDQWSAPTNCDMDVRALVNHMASGLGLAAEVVSGRSMAEIGSRFAGDVLGDDPLAAYDRAVAAAVAAFGRPGGLEHVYHLPYGDLPGAVFCSQKFLDVFIHGWDIARATGQDPTLDPELVHIMYALFEPQAPMLQSSGVFAPPMPVPPGADRQTRLLAMLGRDSRA